jgi:hypothetical protein
LVDEMEVIEGKNEDLVIRSILKEVLMSGTVRLKPEAWDKLTKLAVEATIKYGKPVNQSTVLHFLIDLHLEDIDARMIRQELNEKELSKV